LVNKANALAWIAEAFNGAFSTPPPQLTWAPINFIVPPFGSILSLSVTNIMNKEQIANNIYMNSKKYLHFLK
jgi:hypothetical protein